MKASIKTSVLVKKLKFCNLIVNDSVLSPILGCVLIKFKKEEIEIMCSDTQIAAKIEINDNFEIDEQFDVCVKMKVLWNITSKIKEEKISLIKNVDDNLMIKTNNLECELNSVESEIFPEMKFNTNEATEITLEKDIIKQISTKLPWLSPSQNNNKALIGIHFKFDASTSVLTAYTTDSFRVCKFTTELHNKISNDIAFTISAKSFEKIIPFVLDDDDSQQVEFYISSKDILLKTKHKEILLKRIEEQFPALDHAFENNENSYLIISKKETIAALERVSSVVTYEKLHTVSLEKEKDFYTLEAKSYLLGSCREKLSIIKEEGQIPPLSFNGTYLTEMLKNFDNDEIKLSITSNNKPIILRDLNNSQLEQIILPIRRE